MSSGSEVSFVFLRKRLEVKTMDSPKLFMDEIWTSLIQQSDNRMGAEIQLEEDSEVNADGPVSEEASSSSTEVADNSSVWPVHLKCIRKAPRAACTKTSTSTLDPQQQQPPPATVLKYERHLTPLCSPKSSCLGKRDRNQELKGKLSSRERAVVVKESKWAVHLLSSCAEAIAMNNLHRMQHFMWVLNDLGSLTGDANQRLAAYGLKAFFGKVAGTVAAASAYHLNSGMVSLTATPKNLHNALLKFHDLHPWHQMVYTATNGVLMDSFESKKEIHVIDIGLSLGTQWPTLIEALATRPSGPPSILRLTIVEDPCGSLSPDSSAEVQNRLERFAKVMGLNMELRVIAVPLESLTREALQLTEGEAVAVCVHFRVTQILELEGDEISARDRFLTFLHSELKPELMILGENDSDNSSADFLTVSREVISHFWRFLDSLGAAFKGEDCDERQVIEHWVSRGMINTIAGNLERKETHASWNLRVKNAGFVAEAPQDEVTETVRMLVKKNDSHWEVRNDDNCLVLLWKHQPVTFCSVWRS